MNLPPVIFSCLLLTAFFGSSCERCATCHWEVKYPSGPDTMYGYDLEECGSSDEVHDWIEYQEFLSIEHHKQGYRHSIVICD